LPRRADRHEETATKVQKKMNQGQHKIRRKKSRWVSFPSDLGRTCKLQKKPLEPRHKLRPQEMRSNQVGWEKRAKPELSFTSPRTRLHMAERLREEACLPRASHTDTKNSTPSWNKADCLTESKNPNQETPTQEP
jgi:hypothetical protein